jgi:hypothetical protein
MMIVETLLLVILALLAAILVKIIAMLRLMQDDRSIGHINAIYQINEALHRLSGHEDDQLLPSILRTLETLDGTMADVALSTKELRHAPWRKNVFQDEPPFHGK